MHIETYFSMFDILLLVFVFCFKLVLDRFSALIYHLFICLCIHYWYMYGFISIIYHVFDNLFYSPNVFKKAVISKSISFTYFLNDMLKRHQGKIKIPNWNSCAGWYPYLFLVWVSTPSIYITFAKPLWFMHWVGSHDV